MTLVLNNPEQVKGKHWTGVNGTHSN